MTKTTHTPGQHTPDETAKATALITEALARGPRPISHATARLIAAAINEGHGSPLEHFAATGQFDIELAGHEAQRVFVPTRQEPWRRALLEFLLSMRRSHPWGRGLGGSPSHRSRPSEDPFAGGERQRK